MKTNKFQALKLIFTEGDHGEEAYRVVEGSVEISIQRDGQKLVLAILGAGETFGEMAMIESRPRSATARALELSTIEVIERQDFQQILDEGGEQLVPYLTMIFDRLRVTNDRLLIALDKLNALQPAVKHRHQDIFGSRKTTPQVLIEPDSEEMHRQTALKKRLLRFFPFHFCRRARIAGAKAILQNQILISDRAPFRVSRKHCILDIDGGSVFLEDKTSHLGTIVNGIPIGGKSSETRIKLIHGANTLVLGGQDSKVRFRLDVSAPD
ncbi:MAG: cyclic nucleotide-binding domain-containing protein [Verrucomicrobiota bacterium]|nr:cyclic nucleotide-binding domain-containing protein [Verrucomicrobiota bacterium]